MYKRILVATDGTKLSDKAVVHALRLAKAVGAKVTAFFAAPEARDYGYRDGVLYPTMSRREEAAQLVRMAREVFDPVRKKAAAIGIALEFVQTRSDAPWHAILAAARAGKADVIVMASHGRRGLSAVLLGSETHKVLTHSTIPVIVVR
jgi:nucleotide-binding universal stress UspA family protein